MHLKRIDKLNATESVSIASMKFRKTIHETNNNEQILQEEERIKNKLQVKMKFYF